MLMVGVWVQQVQISVDSHTDQYNRTLLTHGPTKKSLENKKVLIQINFENRSRQR